MTESTTLHAPCLGVTVKTPAGFASAFATTPDTEGHKLIGRAVDFFVARNLLEKEPFKLALIRDDEPIPIDSDKELAVYDIAEGDTLHLVSCRPYVDGAPR